MVTAAYALGLMEENPVDVEIFADEIDAKVAVGYLAPKTDAAA